MIFMHNQCWEDHKDETKPMKVVEVGETEKYFVLECPHCKMTIDVSLECG